MGDYLIYVSYYQQHETLYGNTAGNPVHIHGMGAATEIGCACRWNRVSQARKLYIYLFLNLGSDNRKNTFSVGIEISGPKC